MFSPNLFVEFVLGGGFWATPIPLVALAAIAAYGGWVAVEYIPFTRRILERREDGRG